MTAVDTNVLVRYLVNDLPEQAQAARELLNGLSPEEPGFVCREVLLEVVFVLERAYRFPRDQIANVIEELVSTEGITVEAADDIVQAVSRYRQGGVGFADLLVLAAARRAGALPVRTFDRAFARLDGALLVGHETETP